MDDLERAIADRLRARADATHPPPGLDERIRVGVRVRRRRRRLTELTGVVAAVALVITIPAIVRLDAGRTRPAAPAAGPAGLAVDRIVSVPRTLQGGAVFSALALGPDGTIVGQGVARAGKGRSDGKVWRSGPAGGAPRPVAGAPGLWAAHTDGRHIVWPQNTDDRHDYQLMCAEPGSTPRQLGDQGVTSTEYSFTADAGVVVWNDETEGAPHTVWAARSCDERPRQVFQGGSGVAFAYPDVVVVGERRPGVFDGSLRQVDVESGAAVPLRLTGSPADLAGREDAVFAANGRMLAWADGRAITLVDRRSGAARRLPVRLPHSSGLNGEITRLTAGDGVLVYSTEPQDGDPNTARSVVYDLRTARSYSLTGEAYAAGDRLMWRDGAFYRVGRVR
jgi:hypothetical protein